MFRLYFLALASLPVLLLVLRAPANPSFVWWTTHALEKIRPHTPVPEEFPQAVRIAAARNEFEPFQVVLRADAQDIEGVDVTASALKGPDGAEIAPEYVRIYFQHFINLEFPSSVDGGAGEWPDALIPREDAYFNERRNAFPFRLTDGRTQAIWCEVYVPPSTPPGTYHGEIAVTAGGRSMARVPVVLNVWNFTLPSTASFPTTFGFNGVTALRKHRGRYTNDEDLRELTHVYRKAALLHRISTRGGSMAPPRVRINGGRVHIDWRHHDAEVGPFLDGTVFEDNHPLAGARATTAELVKNLTLQEDSRLIDYYRQFAQHYREKGWFDRLFFYLWDEPEPEHSDRLLHDGRLVHTADPAIRRLVAAPLRNEWRDAVDIWTPVVNCFERKGGFGDFCNPQVDRAGYAAETALGKSVWWYQSCASHGCNIIGGEYFRGWPGYMIDYGAVANRIMPWQSWKYDIAGELYFNMNEAFSRDGDPWANVRYFGGNGDGTLFYPGRPDRIGGATHIPIESIRLKLIREGLEDYEYLAILARTQGAARSAEMVDALVRSAHDFEQDAEKLYAVRERIGRELTP